MIHTCKNCSERFPGCHSVCEKYIEAKKVHDAERAKAYKAQRDFVDFVGVKVDAMLRNKRRDR